MERIQRRFDELHAVAKEIEENSSIERVRTPERPGYIRGSRIKAAHETTYKIDWQKVIQWSTSVQSLFDRLFEPGSPTIESFDAAAKADRVNSVNRFRNMYAVFCSAKEDYEGGYLFELRSLVNAAVFDDELEQASYFLKEGYMIPAAVIAGTVLESTLRELCEQTDGVDLTRATINPMNDALAKASVYNKTKQSQILSWGQIRNSAAHGNKDELNKLETGDIERMIDGIRDFVATHMN